MARVSSFASQLLTPAVVVSVFIHLNGLINEINGRLSGVEARFYYSPIIDLKDSQGKSAVHKAINNRDAQVVSKLIAAGADVNIIDNKEISPLDIAISSEQEEIVVQLINAGADVNIRSNRRFFSSDVTAANRQPKIDSQGFSPLYVAITSGQSEVVSKLITAGAEKRSLTEQQQFIALNQLDEIRNLTL